MSSVTILGKGNMGSAIGSLFGKGGAEVSHITTSDTGATVDGDIVVLAVPHPAVDAERLRLLLREVFTAAGGTHDDWDAYDAEMLAQHRTVVLIVPTRIYSN